MTVTYLIDGGKMLTMIRKGYLVFFVVLTSFLSLSAQTNVYKNIQYAFSVRIPPGKKINIDKPPHPNHGFDINLDSNRFISVYAQYNATFESNSEELFLGWIKERHGGNFKIFSHGPIILGGAKGFRIIGVASDNSMDRVFDYIKLERSPEAVGSTVGAHYTFCLQSSDVHYQSDLLLFGELVSGVKFGKLK